MRAALGGAAALLPAVTEIMGPPDQPAADRGWRMQEWGFSRRSTKRCACGDGPSPAPTAVAQSQSL